MHWQFWKILFCIAKTDPEFVIQTVGLEYYFDGITHIPHPTTHTHTHTLKKVLKSYQIIQNSPIKQNEIHIL